MIHYDTIMNVPPREGSLDNQNEAMRYAIVYFD